MGSFAPHTTRVGTAILARRGPSTRVCACSEVVEIPRRILVLENGNTNSIPDTMRSEAHLIPRENATKNDPME